MRWTIYEGEVRATFVRVTDPGAGDGTGRVKLMEGIIGCALATKCPLCRQIGPQRDVVHPRWWQLAR